MRIFKTLWFHRFCRRENITDQSLLHVTAELEQGLINANLGGGVYKQRLNRQHEGKSGGFRLLICYRENDKAFFTYGFSKSERENIAQTELEDLKKLAHILLSMPDREIENKLEAGAFLEIPYSG